MLDTIRDTAFGQAVRYISGNKLFQYPEERPDFVLPPQYAAVLHGHQDLDHKKAALSDGRDCSGSTSGSETPQATEGDPPAGSMIDLEAMERIRSTTSIRTLPYTDQRLQVDQMLAIQRTKSTPITPRRTDEGLVLVDWYTSDGPENPQNWSHLKKAGVLFILAWYTFTIYCTGPIYAASEGSGIEKAYHISPVAASLGLSLYVLAYGVGDLLFSPLSEIPVIGRDPIYYLTFIVFWALSFGPPVVNSFGGFLALRFFLGFFGSPALANGGATVGDLYSLLYFPLGLCWWVLSAWGGPALGPLMGGWPMWEVVWMASPVMLVLLFFMPETSSSNILLRRARRLRKLTSDWRLQSQSENDQRNLSATEILFSALVRPMEIMLKAPSIFFVNLYTGYFYGVFYTFFECFPLVFPVTYGFSLGETGLAFLPCLIGVVIALLVYIAYLWYYMIPANLKNGLCEQEQWLLPAILGSVLLAIGLFIFAWTVDPHTHWVVPLIGLGIFVMGHFFTMQSLFIYTPLSYPQYAASLFAGNSLWRSATAGRSVVFARPLFSNLGIHDGVTVLGGLSVLGIFGTIAIYVFGKQLRARSKFAIS